MTSLLARQLICAVLAFGAMHCGLATAQVVPEGDRLSALLREMRFGGDREKPLREILSLSSDNEFLVDELKDQLERTRDGFPDEAAVVLASLDGPGVSVLLASLEHADPDVRAAALSGLASLGERGQFCEAQIRQALYDEDYEVRRNAALALGRVSPEWSADTDGLLSHFDTLNYTQREDLLLDLISRGPSVVQQMVALLDGTSRAEKQVALIVLRFYPMEAAGEMEEVLRIAKLDVVLRGPALDLAAVLLATEPAWMPQYLDLLSSLDGEALRDAIVSTEALPEEIRRQIRPIYYHALHDEALGTKFAAADRLMELGEADQEIATCMEQLFIHTDEEVLLSAMEVLVLLGEAGLPVIVRALSSASPETTSAAMRAVAALGAKAEPFVPVLSSQLGSTNPDLARKAADCLSLLGSVASSALPDLLAGLEAKDYVLRMKCIEALGSVGASSPEAVHALAQLLESDDLIAVQSSIGALMRMGAIAVLAIPSLRILENDPVLGYAASKAVAEIQRLEAESR